jgi:hypothetical protein
MPIYLFQCPRCGAFVEDARGMQDFDSPVYCAGDFISAIDLDKDIEIGGEPHYPVLMEHRAAGFHGIVKGGTRFAK